MQATKLLIAAAVVALAAGCLVSTPQQSTSAPPSGSSGNERTLDVGVPAGATQLRVDTTATAQSGTPDVTVLVKDDAGTILATRTFAVSGTTSDTLYANLSGESHVRVVAKVVDGDASLDVRVVAIVPGQPEVVVVHQTIVITQNVAVTTTPSTATTSTPPISTTPTPTMTSPPTSTTPPTTNNTTTNATG
jgi:hypothetical protein